jgi:hypothetical protein
VNDKTSQEERKNPKESLMDEQENMVVEEEMLDTTEETNQVETDVAEVGEKETELADPSEVEEPETTEAETEDSTGQAENSFQADKRKERERKEEIIRKRIERESYRKGLIDAVGGVNPYTGEQMTDDLDVEEYLIMRDIAKGGGDPIADYAKTVKNRQREQKTVTESRAKAENTLNEFRVKHPNVDMSNLLRDERFARFAGKRINSGESLSSVYEDYLAFTADVQERVEKKMEVKARNNQAKAKASPGSLTGGGGDPPKATYSNMSDEAFEKVIAKAKTGALKKS